MLVLSRKCGESITYQVGDVVFTVTQLERGRVGIDAPETVQILRTELIKKATAQNTVPLVVRHA